MFFLYSALSFTFFFFRFDKICETEDQKLDQDVIVVIAVVEGGWTDVSDLQWADEGGLKEIFMDHFGNM